MQPAWLKSTTALTVFYFVNVKEVFGAETRESKKIPAMQEELLQQN